MSGALRCVKASTQYLSLATPANLPTTALTASIWAKASSVAQYNAMFGTPSGGSWTNGWLFFLDNTTKLHVYINTYSERIGASGSFPVGQWVHCLVTWDGTTVRLYQDAVEVASRSTSAPMTHGTVWIGTAPTASSYAWDGDLDSAGVWDRAITAEEIGWLHNHGRGRSYRSLPPSFFRGLRSWWDLSEPTGTRRDSHGRNHLAATNGPTWAHGVAFEPEDEIPFTFADSFQPAWAVRQTTVIGGGSR